MASSCTDCPAWPNRLRARSVLTSATPCLTGMLPGRQGAQGSAERARRSLRRHRVRGVVALRRSDQHAHDGPPGRERPDLLAMAHDRALLADPVDAPHRAQPPLERLRLDLGVLDWVPRLQLAHPAGERHDGEHPARRWVVDVLGRQEPQRPHRRVGDGAPRRRTGRSGRATIAFTGSSAGRPTTGIPAWPKTITTSSSRTSPRTAITCQRTWPTRPSG